MLGSCSGGTGFGACEALPACRLGSLFLTRASRVAHDTHRKDSSRAPGAGGTRVKAGRRRRWVHSLTGKEQGTGS